MVRWVLIIGLIATSLAIPAVARHGSLSGAGVVDDTQTPVVDDSAVQVVVGR